MLALFDVIAGSLKIKSHKHDIVYFKLPAFFIQTNFYKSNFTHLYIWDTVFTGILMILIVNSALSYSNKERIFIDIANISSFNFLKNLYIAILKKKYLQLKSVRTRLKMVT